jgi:hypothetical protein
MIGGEEARALVCSAPYSPRGSTKDRATKDRATKGRATKDRATKDRATKDRAHLEEGVVGGKAHEEAHESEAQFAREPRRSVPAERTAP